MEIKIFLKEKLKRLEKEEIKLHLFEDHHCLYFLQNFPSIKSKEEKESVRINQADEFKNIQNLIQFPYISKQVHVCFIKNKSKKDIQILSGKNNKKLFKNINKVLSKWSNILWSRRVNPIKCQFPKLISRFNIFLIKISISFQNVTSDFTEKINKPKRTNNHRTTMTYGSSLVHLLIRHLMKLQ